jgi:hypothetical protein
MNVDTWTHVAPDRNAGALAPQPGATTPSAPGTSEAGEACESGKPTWGQRLWRFLESLGHPRARRALREAAARVAPYDPELARVLEQACRELGRR